MFYPGDPCSCSLQVVSAEPEDLPDTPLFVILDVYGTMFFAPDFNEFAYYEVDLHYGMDDEMVILPQFEWPAGAGSANDIRFYAGLTNYEMTTLLGTFDMFSFGWSE